MARVRPELLEDLNSVLEKIAEFPGIKSKDGGVFYYKSTPFLHFHANDEARHADIKHGKDWVRIEVPRPANVRARAEFLKTATKYFQLISSKK